MRDAEAAVAPEPSLDRATRVRAQLAGPSLDDRPVGAAAQAAWRAAYFEALKRREIDASAYKEPGS
jgi:hypothetical protein